MEAKLVTVRIKSDLSWFLGSRSLSKGERFKAVQVIGGYLLFHDHNYMYIANSDIEEINESNSLENTLSGTISLLQVIGDKPKSINIEF